MHTEIAIIVILVVTFAVVYAANSLRAKCPKCGERSFGKTITLFLKDDLGRYRQIADVCKFCGTIKYRGSKLYLKEKTM